MTAHASSAVTPVRSAAHERLEQRTIPGLDGIRAIAVILVILFHIGIGPWGPYAVVAFFVLSGFLITWLLLREREEMGGVSIRRFYARRALRIFPAFYVFWLVYVLLAILYLRRHDYAQYAAVFLYAGNYYAAITQPPHFAMNHTWSLAIEEQFYLVWPWVFSRFQGSLSRLTTLLAMFIPAVWIYRIGLHLGFSVGEQWIYYAFDTRADALAVGCLLALMLYQRKCERLFDASVCHAAMPMATLAITIGLVDWAGRYNTTRAFTVAYVALPLLMAVLVWQWIVLSDTAPWAWLQSTPVVYFGRISYSIYLYQWLVCWVIMFRLPELPSVVRAALAIGGSAATATVSYFAVERRFLRMKKTFAWRTSPTPVDLRAGQAPASVIAAAAP